MLRKEAISASAACEDLESRTSFCQPETVHAGYLRDKTPDYLGLPHRMPGEI